MLMQLKMEALEWVAYFIAPISRRAAHKLVFCSASTWHEYLKHLGDEPGLRRRRQMAFVMRWKGLR